MNFSLSFLEVSAQHPFGISRCSCTERSWKHKDGGDSTVAVSLRSHHGINHDWFPSSGLLSRAARWAQQWLSLDRRSSRGGGRWEGGDVCCCLSVCCEPLLLAAIFVSQWTVSTPVSRAKLDLYGSADSCLELLLQRRPNGLL